MLLEPFRIQECKWAYLLYLRGTPVANQMIHGQLSWMALALAFQLVEVMLTQQASFLPFHLALLLYQQVLSLAAK